MAARILVTTSACSGLTSGSFDGSRTHSSHCLASRTPGELAAPLKYATLPPLTAASSVKIPWWPRL